MSQAYESPVVRPLQPTVVERAILFADLAGYSRLMSRDEIGTLELILACAHLIEDLSRQYRGEIVETTGDGFFLLFGSALDALDFGVSLHRLVAKRQTGSRASARFRVGIHAGRVHRLGGRAHGHAVNIAARLEAEAAPGTCMVSDTVFQEVRDRCTYRFEAAGRPPLKNIAEQIALYRVSGAQRQPAAGPEGQIDISAIGELAVTTEEGRVVLPPARQHSALLGYLALASGMRERSDEVASVLWPRKPREGARRSLAACRRQLAGTLKGEAGLLVHDASHIGLDELRVDTDLGRLLEQVRGGRVPDLLHETPRWPERILAGFDSVSPVFAAWLDVTRITWRMRIMTALAELLRRNRPASETSRQAARALIAMEPGHEAASAVLIEHYAATGNRVAALEEFSRLRDYLADRHRLEPGGRVLAALEAIGGVAGGRALRGEAGDEAGMEVAGPAGGPAAQDGARRSRLIRLAVEPFEDDAGGSAHLVTGFRGELVANLAKFREWSVIETARAVAAGAGAEAAEPDAPPALFCHYALGGRYFASEGEPMLRVALVDLPDGRVVWTDDFALSLRSWASSQRDLIGRVAAHLQTYLSADRLSSIVARVPFDLTSHDEWLQAEREAARWTPEAERRAEALLLGIIRRDPGFAPAYSSLAGLRNVHHVVRPGMARDPAELGAARELAERSVELDPLDARNHLAIAWSAALTGAFDRATVHLDLAVRLNPNSPRTLISCAMGYAFGGRSERAEALVEQALRISPMLSDYQWCYVASVHLLAGRFEDTLRAAQLSGGRIVDNQGWAAAALVNLGRTGEARAAFEGLIEAVRPVWAGDQPATAEAVFQWFVGAYPLRREADRRLLRDSLASLLGQVG